MHRETLLHRNTLYYLDPNESHFPSPNGTLPDAEYVKLIECRYREAFHEKNHVSLYDVNLTLNLIYTRLRTIPPPGRPSPMETSPVLFHARTVLESGLLEYKCRLIPKELFKEIPAQPKDYIPWLAKRIRAHSAFRHPFFESFLREKAGEASLANYLVRLATEDRHLEDFIARLQIGAPEEIKLHMAQLNWDLMGKGNPAGEHTRQYTQILNDLKRFVPEFKDTLGLDFLISDNVASLFALRRDHYYKGIGFMAASIYMAASRLACAMACWRRNNLHQNGLDCLETRIRAAEVAADRWLQVVEATIGQKPKTRAQTTWGALLYLNLSSSYLDGLCEVTNHT